MSKENQKEWPAGKPTGEGRSAPIGHFKTSDAILRSGRSLAGPLRMGTAPGVGPRGAPDAGNSDFGMDRITPRRFDPIGTYDTRTATPEESTLLSRDMRRAKKR
jgi:hypothetical protein